MDRDSNGDLRHGHIGIRRFTEGERTKEVGAVAFGNWSRVLGRRQRTERFHRRNSINQCRTPPSPVRIAKNLAFDLMIGSTVFATAAYRERN